ARRSNDHPRDPVLRRVMASQKSTAWTKLGQTDDEPDASDVLKDGYDYFFIEGGGGGPESLLRALGIGSLPNTTYYDIDNGLISNNTLLAQNLSIQNGSFIAETPNDGSQPLAEVIVMTVTSVVLGLMILITVI
ncbi:uncharacterized protein LOC113380939, partial [Ctenocephalides felis]|uniref:uncharacterized protein LOC113380939 n=1 Tax=Ctenocephalides felis TaxID=7515 RepID=UPI000E6E4754